MAASALARSDDQVHTRIGEERGGHRLANILAAPLVALAPRFRALTAPGARVALSGLLERQVDDVRAAYADWCPLDEMTVLDGWVRLSGVTR